MATTIENKRSVELIWYVKQGFLERMTKLKASDISARNANAMLILFPRGITRYFYEYFVRLK